MANFSKLFEKIDPNSDSRFDEYDTSGMLPNEQMAGEGLGNIIKSVIGDKAPKTGDESVQSISSPIDFLPYNEMGSLAHKGLKSAITGIAEAAPRLIGNEAGLIGSDIKNALPLDMSKEARLNRAKQMGFDTSKIYYHGTPHGSIDEFDTYGSNHGLYGKGSYFTDNPNVASEYTQKGQKKMIRNGETPQEAVYPVHIKAENPIDMDAPANIDKWKKEINSFTKYYDIDPAILKPGMTNGEVYKALESELSMQEIPHHEGAEMMQEALMNMGHDSVKHIGGKYAGSGDVLHNVIIPFESQQIRSVNASFDPSKKMSGNILAGLGGAGVTASQLSDEDKFQQLKQFLQK